jgi:hypothetical protein
MRDNNSVERDVLQRLQVPSAALRLRPPLTSNVDMPADGPPDWNKVHRDIYRAKAFDESSWIECADNLLEAARLLEPKIQELWDSYRTHLSDRDILPNRDHYNGPYFMLISFAIENILKAAIVRAKSAELETRFDNDSKFPKEMKGHDLLSLANAAGVSISFEIEDLLRRLSRNAIWSGRYPVPLDHDDSHPAEAYSDGTKYSVAFFGARDVERLRHFVDSLRDELNLPQA